MIKYMLTGLLAFAMHLSASQEFIGSLNSQNKNLILYEQGMPIIMTGTGCGCGPSRPPSMNELLQAIQLVLKGELLLLPEVRPGIVQQVIVNNISNPIVVRTISEVITLNGIGGPPGPMGPQGPAGANGAPGAPGAPGMPIGILDFADFYALMPPDNAATVAIGGDVDFPNDGPTSGSGLIARVGADAFNLAIPGVYQVFFQVSVDEAGQLVLTINGLELPYTVVGRATGTSQLVGMALVQTAVINSILTVRNPADESTALTITPLAGGTEPVSAHLVITRIR